MGNKTKQVVVYFTIIDCQDEFTKNILDAMYKEFETFVEQNTTETKFGMVDLAKSETLADELKCSALSSFHGYIEKELISKTGQTREIEDLKFLCEELKTPENILPYKVKDEADFNKILEDNELVVCDFTASWCGPCQMIGPKFKEMAKEQVKTSTNMMGTTELVKFVKVEQTENKELVTKQGVTAYPTFHLYKNGTKKSEVKGVDEEGLKFAIKQLIDEDYKHWAEYSKTEADFDDIVAKNDLVFVDFTATWCPPCKMIGPIFEELATENKDKILKLNSLKLTLMKTMQFLRNTLFEVCPLLKFSRIMKRCRKKVSVGLVKKS